jgi:hypothetical protein
LSPDGSILVSSASRIQTFGPCIKLVKFGSTLSSMIPICAPLARADPSGLLCPYGSYLVDHRIKLVTLGVVAGVSEST